MKMKQTVAEKFQDRDRKVTECITKSNKVLAEVEKTLTLVTGNMDSRMAL